MKQEDGPVKLVSLSVRVPQDTFDRFKRVADAQFRPMAAELRRMIQERVDAAELEEAA